VGWTWIWLDASKPSTSDRINIYRGVWTLLDVAGLEFESLPLRHSIRNTLAITRRTTKVFCEFFGVVASWRDVLAGRFAALRNLPREPVTNR
jgi:hypothetical protein